jgi:hypothetical protein
MKRTSIAVVLLSAALVLPAGGDRFFVSAGAAALLPADSRFADTYGKVQLSPELRAGYNLYRHFYFWLGGGFCTASWTIPVVEEKSAATQAFLSLGAGWETRRTRRLQADLTIALLMAGFREKAMGATASKWAPGFDVRIGLRHFLKQRLFLGMTVGYAGAWTSIRTETGESDIVLGGVRLGGLVGFRF